MLKVLLFSLISTSLLAAEPEWLEVKPVRKVSSTGVMGDIESHLDAGNPFTNGNVVKLTDVHEGTHGLNNKVRVESGVYNGFYVLKNRGLKVLEPKTTIDNVIKNIPLSMRGINFERNIKGPHVAQWWNNQPLYIVDEWVAYSNGMAYLLDVKDTPAFKVHEVCPQASVDLMLCSFALLKTCPADYPDRAKLSDFIKWNADRVLDMADNWVIAQESFNNFRYQEDCRELRRFIIGEFGQTWADQYNLKVR